MITCLATPSTVSNNCFTRTPHLRRHSDYFVRKTQKKYGTLLCKCSLCHVISFPTTCLALPCLVPCLPCLALPCLMPCLALCLACLALPCLALPCLALPSHVWDTLYVCILSEIWGLTSYFEVAQSRRKALENPKERQVGRILLHAHLIFKRVILWPCS